MEGHLYPGAYAGSGRLWTGRLLTKARGAVLCAAVVGLIGLGFYLATLAPGLTWAHDSGDGGQLAAAARTLGVAHPPGYPTYLLLANLFTRLPVGEVATRTNLFSAICAALTAALLAWTLARMGGSGIGAVGAGLALAVSPLLWSQATVTEVHALNGLFTSLLLALAAVAEPGFRRNSAQTAWLALLAGGLWGISLGNHPTALFCAPLLLLFLLRSRRFGLGVIGVFFGLVVYLYLPLRAAVDPPINWGNPQTPEQFWWVISGGPYRQFLFSLPLAYLPTRFLAWARLLTQQFTWLGMVVATLGAAVLWTAKRPLFAATGTTVVLCSVFALVYNTSDSYLYLIPALVSLGLWLGVGINWLLAALAARALTATRAAATLTIALPLAAGICRFPTQNLSGDHAAYDFGATLLQQAPPRAVILSQRDAHTFTLWYFQHALDHRPDIAVVDLDLLAYDWYAVQMSRLLATPLLVDVELAGGEGGFQQVAMALNRPVCRMDSGGRQLRCAKP